MIAGIETGGTKVVCGFADEATPGKLIETRRILTSGPQETLAAVDAFLADVHRRHGVRAVGIATFGPINVQADAERYGWITATSKPGWANTDLLGALSTVAGLPVALMSDVSGAALGELRFGAGRGAHSLGYATFGTGVGVGIVRDGRVTHGNGFPEIGHLLVRRHPLDDYAGWCPFHGDCAEGLAAGPAILARWGADTSSLPASTRPLAFEIIGFYIAQVVAAVGYVSGVERFVLGGGVLNAPGLLDAVRRSLPIVTGGPEAGHAITSDPSEFIRGANLGELSGVLGAIDAARAALQPADPILTGSQS